MAKAFLSHSFNQADKVVVDHIRALLEARGFQITMGSPSEMPSLDSPAEKIRSLIRTIDCLIAIITKNSDWIQNEIGMAYMARKPIYVICEIDQKPTDSLSSYITDFVQFDRMDIGRLGVTLSELQKAVQKKLEHGARLHWYGEAVFEIVSQIEYASQIDIMGRSTDTFYDALNPTIRELLSRNQEKSIRLSVFFEQDDDDSTEIRTSARRTLPKWRKLYSRSEFFVLPKSWTQIRAIMFNRDENRGFGFAGNYTKIDRDVYLGVTNLLERFDHTSVIYHVLLQRMLHSSKYDLDC